MKGKRTPGRDTREEGWSCCTAWFKSAIGGAIKCKTCKPAEIAFNDPPGGDTERKILNDHLHKLMQQRFLQQIAVDSIFGRRLVEILKICIPSIWSKEACQVVLQACLLYSRTLLTERIAYVEGKTGQAVVSKVSSSFILNLICADATYLRS